MIFLRSVVLPFDFALFLLNSKSYVDASKFCTGVNSEDKGEDCYIYLAPSSIHGAGSGVFVTRSFKKGELIMSSDYGNIIPIIDPYVNPNHSKWTGLFNDYIWTQPSGASNELKYEAEKVVDLQLGLGIFPNSHSMLHNLGFSFPKTTYDYEPEESPSFGSGAYSRHKGRDFVALRDIQEGEELFLDYGDDFLDSRPESLSKVPRKEDFKIVSDIVKGIKVELDRMSSLLSHMKEIRFDVRQETIDEIASYMLSIACKSLQIEASRRNRVCEIIPQSLIELQHLFQQSHEISDHFQKITDPVAFSLAFATTERRNNTWLYQNGVCLDNLYKATSTIPNAGNGAKSKRFVRRGGLISTMPLLQIPDRELLANFHVVVGNDRISHDANIRIGNQLLLNYCFGHRDSSILLCPTTNAIFANHCSESFNCIPNAYFKWSNDSKTEEWLNLSIEEIAMKRERGLSFDLIAKRDIHPHEEIFVDYGTEWEDHWKQHRLAWNKHGDFKQINLRESNDNVFTGCLFWEKPGNKWPRFVEIEFDFTDWSNLEDQIVLDLFAEDGSHYTAKHNHIQTYWPCSIVHYNRHDKYQTSYTVRLFQPHWEKIRWTHENTIPRFLVNYPSSSVRSFTKPYSSDIHDPAAFRHHVDIHDDIFPDKWRNRGYNSLANEEFDVGDRVLIDMTQHQICGGTVINIQYSPKGKLYTILNDDGTIEYVSSSSLKRVTHILYSASTHPYL